MPKVLITDNVAAEGIDLLKKHVPVDVKLGNNPCHCAVFRGTRVCRAPLPIGICRVGETG